MAAIAFDTLIQREQSQSEQRADGTTARLESKMQAHFTRVESQMDVRFAKVDGEIALLKWMLGVVVAGVLALVMKAFLHA